MVRKKPILSLRRPTDAVNPLQAERFVRGLVPDPLPARPGPGKIADVEAFGLSGVETSERSVAQKSERPVRASAPTSASKSLVYRKRTDDLRRRMTIYLSEDLSRRLRIYAAEQDQDYSVVLAEALGALLDQKGVR